MRSLETCKKGDVLMASDGSKAKVLFRIEDVIARSAWYAYDVYSELLTIKDAKTRGYRLLDKDGKYPMKKSEVEELLNIKILKN